MTARSTTEEAALKTRRLAEERLLASRRARTQGTSNIPKSKQCCIFPLSSAQTRLWFLEELEPGSPLYVESRGMRATGDLRLVVLEASLAEIIRRHQSLRTVFRATNDIAEQIVLPTKPVQLPVADLSQLHPEHHERLARRLATESAYMPFDLVLGPLYRFSVLRKGNDEHLVCVNLHHITADGWSVGILVKELSRLYKDYLTGAASPLTELRMQFGDFSLWRQTSAKKSVEVDRTYWEDRLSGIPPLLQMPTDHPRTVTRSLRGGKTSLSFGEEISQDVQAFCRQEGVTPFVFFMAAYQALLLHYTGQDDFCVGVPTAGRRQRELEGLIGFFVNTLVSRSECRSDRSFHDLLKRVADTSADAFAHQDFPFEKLVEAVKTERSLTYSPIFQVMFAYQNAPQHVLELPDLEFEETDIEASVPKFEQVLSLWETEGKFEGTLEYSAALYDQSTTTRMLGHLEQLVRSIIADPNRQIADLCISSEYEQAQQVFEWNDTLVQCDEPVPIHGSFANRARLSPDALALIYCGEHLTYGELENQASAMASQLVRMGVGPNCLVGLFTDRCIEMVVGMLAVLKAGAAYVPLDPTYPDERLAFIVEDSGMQLVMTEESIDSRGLFDGVATLSLEASLSITKDSVSRAGCLDSLAYLIYTSGSTGRPKAVGVEHLALANYMRWFNHLTDMAPQDRMMQRSSAGFDISVSEIFAPLTGGGALVLAEPHASRDAHLLTQGIVRDEVTLLRLVPGLLQMLLSETDLRHARSLRWVACGGEAVKEELSQRWFDLTGVRLCATYGPTEATINAATWSRTGEPDAGIEPLGFPPWNYHIHVSTNGDSGLPVGASGELRIGGIGLARGYIGRAGATSKTFTPNDLSDEMGSRLYATGDLCKRGSNGLVEYLGRTDFQVKVRGFRIELGEIELALLDCKGVENTVVISREPKGLIAYVVANSGDDLDAEYLRNQLGKTLPDYMLPSVFVFLDAFPLLPNGKINRGALPMPQTGRGLKTRFVAPQTRVEQALSTIWREVLDVDRVGLEDNFFDLGGHSLLATQVVSRIRRELGVELALRELFDKPSIAELGTRVSEILHDGLLDQAPKIRRVRRAARLPLSFAQQRLWFLDQLEPGSSLYNMPAALRARGKLVHAALGETLGEICRRHESLRTRFASEDGIGAQIIDRESTLAVTCVDLGGLEPPTQEPLLRELAKLDAQRAFDLSRNPLLRSTLVRLAHTDHVVLFAMHHIVSDGWSMGVLVQEFGALYPSYEDGLVSGLAELPFQYPDYSSLQLDESFQDPFSLQKDYWLDQLSGVPALLELPTDRPRSAVQTSRGSHLRFSLSRELLSRAESLGRAEGATLFMTLLAVYQTLLMRYTGQSDICVGSPIAGRRHSELEGLIGLFMNTLVLRSRTSATQTFREFLGCVREASLDAQANQDFPFEQLVDALGVERSLSHSAIFQVMFVLQNAPSSSLSLPDLELNTLAAESGVSKFDQTLDWVETSEGLSCTLEYNTDLFDSSTIARMSQHFERLFEHALSAPDVCLGDLTLLSDEEQAQLLSQWNDTATDYRDDKCIHELFEEQAARTPDSVALVFDDEHLTYNELCARSEDVATTLIGFGVAADVLVALIMDRCLEMVVGLLGILRSGAAYIPLDPELPSERLASTLEDGQPGIVLAQRCFCNKLTATSSRILYMDDILGVPQTAQNASLCANGLANLSYVIFTSGSTGRPKGVAVGHQALSNFMISMRESPGLSRKDRLVAVTTVSFDIAALEIYLALLVGARVVVAGNNVVNDGWQLGKLCEDVGATVLQGTPSTWRLLVEADSVRPGLKSLCGGEALPLDLAETLLAKNCALWNMYGPTETTIWSSVECVTGADSAGTIGRPIRNTEIRALDGSSNNLPLSGRGIIHIGRVGLARGYLDRVGMSALTFRCNGEGAKGERLYNVGDNGRYTLSGKLQCLGRVDHQVKIRGFRIELGEIEATLAAYSEVSEAVVLARTGTTGAARLVAYLVWSSGTELSVHELRERLGETLPDYMIPSTFVFLDALPLTPNGKVDRKALPDPEISRDESIDYVAPRTETESRLVEIWGNVLGVDLVGIHDNFFELGGHSLNAVLVVSQIKKRFGVDLKLRAFFETPTVEALAARILAQQVSADDENLINELLNMTDEEAERLLIEYDKKSG